MKIEPCSRIIILLEFATIPILVVFNGELPQIAANIAFAFLTVLLVVSNAATINEEENCTNLVLIELGCLLALGTTMHVYDSIFALTAIRMGNFLMLCVALGKSSKKPAEPTEPTQS